MKTRWMMFALYVLPAIVSAQDLTIIYQGDTVTATRWKPGAKVWIAELKGEKFYLVRDSVIRSMSFDTDSALAVVRHHEEVLHAQQALLQKYETYQAAAEKHIAKQNEIIAIGDSLYRGYKSIYEDLKRVTGFSTWSVAASLIPVRSGDTHLLYSLGFGYGNISLQYVGGKDTDGIMIGYRYPF